MHTLSLYPQLNGQSSSSSLSPVPAACSYVWNKLQHTAYTYSTCRCNFPTAGNLPLFVFLVFICYPSTAAASECFKSCSRCRKTLSLSSSCDQSRPVSTVRSLVTMYNGKTTPHACDRDAIHFPTPSSKTGFDLQTTILHLITGSFHTRCFPKASKLIHTFFGDPLQLIAMNQNNIGASIFSTKF